VPEIAVQVEEMKPELLPVEMEFVTVYISKNESHQNDEQKAYDVRRLYSNESLFEELKELLYLIFLDVHGVRNHKTRYEKEKMQTMMS
jgi:hypothetical protein